MNVLFLISHRIAVYGVSLCSNCSTHFPSTSLLVLCCRIHISITCVGWSCGLFDNSLQPCSPIVHAYTPASSLISSVSPFTLKGSIQSLCTVCTSSTESVKRFIWLVSSGEPSSTCCCFVLQHTLK